MQIRSRLRDTLWSNVIFGPFLMKTFLCEGSGGYSLRSKSDKTILIIFRQNTDFCHSVNCVSKSFIFSIMAQETIIIVESHYYHSHYYVPRMPKRMPAEIAGGKLHPILRKSIWWYTCAACIHRVKWENQNFLHFASTTKQWINQHKRSKAPGSWIDHLNPMHLFWCTLFHSSCFHCLVKLGRP